MKICNIIITRVMKNENKKNNKKNMDEEIRFFLQKKKDENSALRKLLIALENTKSINQMDRIK
jgi:hypothetical protein